MSANRWVCPACGANNLSSVSVCWKCGKAPGQQAVMPAISPPGGPQATLQPLRAEQSPAQRFSAYSGAAAHLASVVNPGKANRAAFWLGVLFPYFGYPIGLAFMMCDDPRRQEVGRACILWSTISGVVHLILTFVFIAGLKDYAALVFGAMRNQAAHGGGDTGLSP